MKKFLKKNIIIKMVAIVLVAATVMGIAWNESFVKTKASGKVRTENVVTCGDEDDENVDEIQYTDADIVSSDFEDLGNGVYKTVVVRTDGTKFVSIIDSTVVTMTTYDENDNVIKEEVINLPESVDEIDDEELGNQEDPDYVDDYEDLDDEDFTRGKTKWNKAVKEKYSKKNNMWYRIGSNGSKIYYRIGSKAKYQIRYDKLDETKQKNCDSYLEFIDKINSRMKLAYAAGMGIGATVTVVIGLIISYVTGGMSAPEIMQVLSKNPLGIALGSGAVGSMVAGVIGASDYRQKAKNMYVKIRTYGKKYE